MSLIKITELTKQLGLSSRTLRYYEQEGLIESLRLPSESYRYYDDAAVQRLRQIQILRKMQIPVREIFRVYENPDIITLVEVFSEKIAEIDREVTALSELKEVINTFLREMTAKGIKQISALPLLYEEMEKQMELLEDLSVRNTQEQHVAPNSSQSALRQLDHLQKQLSAPPSAAILHLPPHARAHLLSEADSSGVGRHRFLAHGTSPGPPLRVAGQP